METSNSSQEPQDAGEEIYAKNGDHLIGHTISDHIFHQDLQAVRHEVFSENINHGMVTLSEGEKEELVALTVSEVDSTLESVTDAMPKQVHPINTSGEISNDLRKSDKVIVEILRPGSGACLKASNASYAESSCPNLPKVTPPAMPDVNMAKTFIANDWLSPFSSTKEKPMNEADISYSNSEVEYEKQQETDAVGQHVTDEEFRKSRTGVVKVQKDGQLVVSCPKPLKRSPETPHRGTIPKNVDNSSESPRKKMKIPNEALIVSEAAKQSVGKNENPLKYNFTQSPVIEDKGAADTMDHCDSGVGQAASIIKGNSLQVADINFVFDVNRKELKVINDKTAEGDNAGKYFLTHTDNNEDSDKVMPNLASEKVIINKEAKDVTQFTMSDGTTSVSDKIKDETDTIGDKDFKDNVVNEDRGCVTREKRTRKLPKRFLDESVDSNKKEQLGNFSDSGKSVRQRNKRGRKKKYSNAEKCNDMGEVSDNTNVMDNNQKKPEMDSSFDGDISDVIEVSKTEDIGKNTRRRTKKILSLKEESNEEDVADERECNEKTQIKAEAERDEGRVSQVDPLEEVVKVTCFGVKKEECPDALEQISEETHGDVVDDKIFAKKPRGRPKKKIEGDKLVRKLRKGLIKGIKPSNSVLLYCAECDVDFSSRHQEGKHEECGSAATKVQCELCRLFFRSKKSALNHKQMRHSVTTSVSCVCGLIFHNRRDAKNHHRMCLKFKIFNGQERKSKGPYTCEKCGEVLKTIKTYTKHMQKAHSCVKEPHSSYICKVCGKEFTRVTSLLNHEKYVHSTPNVQCPFCDKKVKNKVSLLYHVQTHREILAIYGADPLDLKPVFKLNDIASTQVGEENVLVTFEEMMHQRKDNRQSFKYHCPLCEHKYNSDREMKGHILQSHGMVNRKSKDPTTDSSSVQPSMYWNPRWLCQLCGKQFYQKNAYNDHIAIHNGKATEECKECGRQFITKTAFQRHMRFTHFVYSNGTKIVDPPQKQVECPVCNALIHKSGLRKHVDKHNGIYRFTCSVCGKKCRSHYDLQNHERTHTGEQPYSCEKCGRKFGDRANLRHHEKRIHNVTTPKERNIRVVGFHTM